MLSASKLALSARAKSWCCLAIALAATATAIPANSAVKSTLGEQSSLGIDRRQALASRVTVSGNRGQYTARVVVKAPVGKAWEVLTDYNNFDNFLPNVNDSRLLKSNGNRKVFTQVNIVRALVFNKQFRVEIAANETYLKKIDFRVVKGDIKSLKGSWRLEQLSGNRVAVVHQVSVDPGASPNRDIFYKIYKDSLKETLSAIGQEIERRSS